MGAEYGVDPEYVRLEYQRELDFVRLAGMKLPRIATEEEIQRALKKVTNPFQIPLIVKEEEENMQRKEGSVVQDWLADRLSFKQQTVLLSALRGCDGIAKEDVSKALTRAFRSAILNPAEDHRPASSFMWVDTELDNKTTYFVEHTDHYPVHWVLHFAHACEIVGYKHPQLRTSVFWSDVYQRICRAFHMHPETENACDFRLRDNSSKESA